MSNRDDRPEACTDCGGDTWPGRFDRAPFLCDECYAMRDRWATDQEARLTERRMVKADFTDTRNPGIPVSRQKDVA